jgi:hypothetical protein
LVPVRRKRASDRRGKIKKRREALDLFARFVPLAFTDADPVFPEYVNLSPDEVDRYWEDWAVWRATGKKFLFRPGGLNDQDDRQMTAIMELDGLFSIVEALALKQRMESKDGES